MGKDKYILIILLSIQPLLFANVYYVSPTGNDSDEGSINRTFATIQQAINKARNGEPNNYDIVRVKKGVYFTEPIYFNHDNQGLFIEDGTTIIAKSNKGFNNNGPFSAPGATLFNIKDRNNISILAYGVTIQMRKEEYEKLPGEWRACITLFGCSNVQLLGLTLKDAGGDGFDISPGTHQEYCKDILIKDITCDNNMRNAISVISVDGLKIENCVLKNTNGKKPGAGIDLEPNKFIHRLNHIVISNTLVFGNEGYAIIIYPVMLRNTDKTTRKKYIDVLFENVTVRDGQGVYVSYFSDDGPDGVIKFKNLLVENTTFGTWIGKSSKYLDLIFEDCTWRNIKKENPPLSIFRNDENTVRPGGIKFNRCKIFDSFGRPVIIYSGGNPLYDIHGDIDVNSINYNGPLVDWRKAELVNVDIVVKSDSPAGSGIK